MFLTLIMLAVLFVGILLGCKLEGDWSEYKAGYEAGYKEGWKGCQKAYQKLARKPQGEPSDPPTP